MNSQDPHKKEDNWRKDRADIYKEYVKVSAVGLEVALSIILGVLAGYFTDRYFESEPIGLIVGIIVGGIAAAQSLYRFSKKYLKENESSKKDQGED